MRFSIQHGLTACNVSLSAPCVAGQAPKLTINGTAITVATVRIVGKPETIGVSELTHYRIPEKLSPCSLILLKSNSHDMAQSTLIPGVDSAGKQLAWQSVARLIDHTLLKPEATRAQVIQLCEEAVVYNFACAFIHQTWGALAVSIVRGTGVKVGVPAGFPQGASLTSVKRFEAEEALRIGVSEVDMVMNIGALKSGDRNLVQSDISGVAQVVHNNGGILKVILETSLLTLDEKIVACQLAVAAGADFVKTSTGFAGGGATVDDIALMRGVVGEKLGVKASGGVRIAADALAMIQAGANRIGTSAGVAIVRDLGAPVATEPVHVSSGY